MSLTRNQIVSGNAMAPRPRRLIHKQCAFLTTIFKEAKARTNATKCEDVFDKCDENVSARLHD